MEQAVKPKKTLHLKIVLVTALAVFFPYVLGLFTHLTPILSILVAAGSTILSLIVLFWILKPLKLLIKGTGIFSDGNLNHRIDIRSGDEFEDVGNSFNLMADKLSKTIQNLENDRAIAI